MSGIGAGSGEAVSRGVAAVPVIAQPDGGAPSGPADVAPAATATVDRARLAGSGAMAELAQMARILDGAAASGFVTTTTRAAGSGSEALVTPEEQLADLQADPSWASLSEAVQAELAAAILKHGAKHPELLAQLKELISQPGFATLAGNEDNPHDQAVAVAIAAIAREGPGQVPQLVGMLGVVVGLLRSDGYRSAAPGIQEEVRNLLAADPALAMVRTAQLDDGSWVAVSLWGLLQQEGFRRLSRSERTRMLRELRYEGVSGEAVDRLAIEMAERTRTAEAKAAVVAKLLRAQRQRDSDVSFTEAEARLLGFEDATELHVAVLYAIGQPPGRSDPLFTEVDNKGRMRDAILVALSGEDASDVLLALERNHREWTDAFYGFFITDEHIEHEKWGESRAPESDEREKVKQVLDHLDPRAAAHFTSGIIRALKRRTDSPSLIKAALEGLSLEVGFEWKGVSIKWDPTGLIKGWLEDHDLYARLLDEMLLHLTKTRSISDEQSGWDADEREEFIQILYALEGGDPLTAGARSPGEPPGGAPEG